MPCNSRNGQQQDLFGPEAAHVNHSQLLEPTQGNQMNATYGPNLPVWLTSAGLQQSLENRLRARLGVNGSMEYALTWKVCNLPSLPPICALRSLKHPPDTRGFIGWHRPAARDWKDSPGMATVAKNPDGTTRLRVDQLPRQVRLCLTPAAWMPCQCCEDYICTIHGMHAYDCECPPMEEWETDPYDPGQTLTPFLASMVGAGFNPAHSRWLMGFPPEWDDCAVTAMPSSRKPQRSSSKPSTQPV